MKLLVAVDGSAASLRAVEFATRLAQATSGSLVLLNVQNRGTLDLSDIDAGERDERAVAAAASDRILARAAARCHAGGVSCVTRGAFGPLAETIAGVAATEHADQIVMGTHGRGRVGAAMLGSVAQGVIHAAHVPVTLLKGGGHAG
ncbi:universal stress protein [Acidisphaera rubrifaciens]|uniref:UspA domain-containing protein n=1 Tax=Acidisphaera rubrifaciens HS-AP3 TaxID=1231350 RepID=A0A0D6PAL1_9PROT|nr:universal stress protein [Acidisphaera rubrifaciens]GAN77914.1 hypothetical protein Asru_0510_05 [Acidisphaera rubrifaciens HS-AP3]